MALMSDRCQSNGNDHLSVTGGHCHYFDTLTFNSDRLSLLKVNVSCYVIKLRFLTLISLLKQMVSERLGDWVAEY